jgi:ankyrin repeat protein
MAASGNFYLDLMEVLWHGEPSRPKGIYTRILRRYARSRLHADINTRQNPQQPSIPLTPLAVASIQGYEVVVVQLVSHGALVNLEAGPEGTPLMAACTYGRLSIVKILVRFGALLCTPRTIKRSVPYTLGSI